MGYQTRIYQAASLDNKTTQEKCAYIFHRFQFFLTRGHEAMQKNDFMEFHTFTMRLVDNTAKMSTVFAWDNTLSENYRETCQQWERYFTLLMLMENKYINDPDEKNYQFLLNHLKKIEENWRRAEIPEKLREKEKTVIQESYQGLNIPT